MKNVRIGDRLIGDGQPTFVVAETAWSHDGSLEKAKVMVDIAADGGADAINFHITSVPDYIVPNYGLDISPLATSDDPESAYNYLQNINLKFEDFAELSALSHSRGLAVSAMCNDEPSLDFAADKIQPEIIMIHPSCVGDDTFVARAAGKGKPLLLYVGGLTLGEIERAILTAVDSGCDEIVLQHGFQSYPTPIEENNLGHIATLKRLFDRPVAFGDHTDGGDPFALVIPAVAVGLGANVIEKHITHDRELKGEDHESALDGRTFGQFVRNLRDTETAIGSSAWRPLGDRQKSYRNTVRKRAVALREIPAGTPLDQSMVVFKRATSGVYPEELGSVIGRKAASAVPPNGPITHDVFV